MINTAILKKNKFDGKTPHRHDSRTLLSPGSGIIGELVGDVRLLRNKPSYEETEEVFMEEFVVGEGTFREIFSEIDTKLESLALTEDQIIAFLQINYASINQLGTFFMLTHGKQADDEPIVVRLEAVGEFKFDGCFYPLSYDETWDTKGIPARIYTPQH